MPPEKEYNPLKMSRAPANSYEQLAGLRATPSKQASEPQASQASEKGYNSKWSANE